MHVATSNGAGMKACTWSGREPLGLRNTAKPGMASKSGAGDVEELGGAEQLTDRGIHARQAFAFRFDFGPGAALLVIVRGGPANVADDALELGIGRNFAHFVQDRCFRARLDDAALMGRDRAKRAA